MKQNLSSLTSGQAAKALHVSMDTVNKWADNGRLKSWRVPGSYHRRFELVEARAFAEKYGIPVGNLPKDPG